MGQALGNRFPGYGLRSFATLAIIVQVLLDMWSRRLMLVGSSVDVNCVAAVLPSFFNEFISIEVFQFRQGLLDFFLG